MSQKITKLLFSKKSNAQEIFDQIKSLQGKQKEKSEKILFPPDTPSEEIVRLTLETQKKTG